jgi:curved DNA-binding protein CbpA
MAPDQRRTLSSMASGARGGQDPYRSLGVSPSASDDELRAAYRMLVQRHHPDHNNGSPAAARRFEEVQEAYAEIRELRRRAPPTASAPPPRPPVNPHVESRLADLERELRQAAAARASAQRAAREARAASTGRATDEELGYVETDDSFSKIFADAQTEIADRLFGPEQHPAARRVADLIDELESKIKGRPKPPRGD